VEFCAMATAVVNLLMAAFSGPYADWSGKLVLAQQLEAHGRYAEALPEFQHAAALADRFGPHDPRTWATYDRLAIVYEENGDIARSVATYHHILAMVKAAAGTSSREYERILANLGTVYLEDHQDGMGENLLRQARRIELAQPQPAPLHVAMIDMRLAQALYNRGHYEEAAGLLTNSLPVIEEHGQARDVASALNSLGLIRKAQHRYDESLELSARTVAVIENNFGSSHPLLLSPLNNLGGIYAAVGRTSEAEAAYQRAMRIAENTLGPDHPWRVTLLENYAVFLRSTGEKRQAKAMLQQARSLARQSALRQGTGMTVDVSSFRDK